MRISKVISCIKQEALKTQASPSSIRNRVISLPSSDCIYTRSCPSLTRRTPTQSSDARWIKAPFGYSAEAAFLQIVFCSSPVSLSQNGKKPAILPQSSFCIPCPLFCCRKGRILKTSVQRLSPDRNKFRLVHKRMFQGNRPFIRTGHHTAATIIAFSRINYNGMFPLCGIGYHNIHLAHICTAVTAVISFSMVPPVCAHLHANECKGCLTLPLLPYQRLFI